MANPVFPAIPSSIPDASRSPGFPRTPVLLVDGDIVAYRCSAAAEKTKYLALLDAEEGGVMAVYFDTAKEAKDYAEPLGFDVWSRKEVQPVEHAIQIAKTSMQAIATKFPDAIVQVYLSGDRNFRDGIWQTRKYKGNRTADRPKHLESVRDFLKTSWFATVSNNQEADDDIGIASGAGTVVVSTDKDLDQIPGWHWNFVSDETYYVSEKDAKQFIYEQVIAGDAVDNIPGLPGYGIKTARKYLDQHEDKREATIKLFLEEGKDYAYFHEMETLVTILRKPR